MIDNTYSVSDVIDIIASYIDEDPYLTDIEVVGEVADLKIRGTHAYFSLVDERSRLPCVWFGRGRYVNFKDGDMIKIFGSVRVYKKKGTINLHVEDVSRLYQKGMFMKNFEMLFIKLSNMGVFARERNSLPELPRKIGIIASIDSAALRDILKTLKEKAPLTVPHIFHAQVQGENAPDSLAGAIKEALNYDLDALIISRGGGSNDDLWVFNDERVVNAVLDAALNHKIPVISGIGHATDYVILDIIADYPVHTPTAAAELIANKQKQVIDKLHGSLNRIVIQCRNILEKESLNLSKITEKIIGLVAYLVDKNSRVLEHEFSVIGKRAPENIVDKERLLNLPVKFILKSTESKLKEFETSLKNLWFRIERSAFLKVDKERSHLRSLIGIVIRNLSAVLEKDEETLNTWLNLIRKLSPESVMERGFLIAFKDGKVVKSINELKVGEELELVLKDGKARVIVNGIQPDS